MVTFVLNVMSFSNGVRLKVWSVFFLKRLISSMPILMDYLEESFTLILRVRLVRELGGEGRDFYGGEWRRDIFN